MPAELTAEFEMVPAAGRSLTEIEADFDETDQSIGYGFDQRWKVGSQLGVRNRTTLTVYPDALFVLHGLRGVPRLLITGSAN